jgi:hypothetical protein
MSKLQAPRSGVLIRFYPALELKSFRERLPADVLNFAQGDPAFPADQLSNQWMASIV